MSSNAAKRVAELRDLLERANVAYYVDAAPFMVEETKNVPESVFVGVKTARFRLAHHAAQARSGQFLLELGHAHRVDTALNHDVSAVRGDTLCHVFKGQVEMARNNAGQPPAVRFQLGEQLAVDHY